MTNARDRVKIEVISGVEGPSLYIDDYRVCGPKPWGGGKVLCSWVVKIKDIDRATKEDT